MSVLPPALEKQIQDTMGDLYIGVVIGAVFFGITTLQTFFYYITYPKDRLLMKLLVGFVWVLDAASLAFYAASIYEYLIIDILNPGPLLSMYWSIVAEFVLSSHIALIVHLFLCHRIYALNNEWKIYASCLATFSLFPYSLALYATGKAFMSESKLWTDIGKELNWIQVTADATTSAQDLAIAATIVYQLYTSKTGWGRTERIINLLIIYTINTGMFSTMIAIANLIAAEAAPLTLLSLLFNISISKAYANTFLATLNSRQSVRGKAFDPTLTPETLPTLNFTPGKMPTRSTTTGSMGTTGTTTDHFDLVKYPAGESGITNTTLVVKSQHSFSA